MNTTSTGPTQTTLPTNPLFYDGKNFAGPIESLVRVSTILDLFQDVTSQEDTHELCLSTGSVAGLSLLLGLLQKTVDQSLEIISEENKTREGKQ